IRSRVLGQAGACGGSGASCRFRLIIRSCRRPSDAKNLFRDRRLTMRFRAHLALMVLSAVLLVAAPRARTQQGTTRKPFDLIEWSGGKFIYGVDYYPE